jgi:hypothetical protein
MHLKLAATVSDYFKHFIKKTGARNRSGMLGRILG